MERIDLTGPYPRVVTEGDDGAPISPPPRRPKRVWHDVFYMGLFGLLLAFAQTVMQTVQTIIDIFHR